MLLGALATVLLRADWQASLTGAFHDALVPLCSDGRVATAALWALAAMVLPWVVRGPHAAERAVGAIVWAAGLIVAGLALSSVLGVPRPPLPFACGALAAVLAFAVLPRRRSVPVPANVA